MDQIKIGKFIATKRKEKNLTQVSLAEKLGITDRAVSKWETGKSLPDSSIMIELCDILGISVNELLCGEVIDMKDYETKTQATLLELKKREEDLNKKLLFFEVVIGVGATIVLFIMVFAAAYATQSTAWRVGLIVSGFVIFIIGAMLALKIETEAGYYECKHCGEKYVPSYAAVNLAMHMGRTRYLKCPKCGKKSWSKKVLSK